MNKKTTLNNEPTVATSWVDLLIDTAKQEGVDLTEELQRLKITDQMLIDPYGRISVSLEQQLLNCAVEKTGDKTFGLHMGENVRPSAVGMLGYASMSSATLRDAIVLMIQYERFRTDIARCEVEENQSLVTLVWDPETQNAEYHRQRVEATLSGWVNFGRWVTGKANDNPQLICFQHKMPEDISEYQRIFRCEVKFNQPHNSASIAKSLLEVRLKDSDPEVFRVVKSKLEQMVSAYDARGNLLQQVKVAIENDLANGTPSLESVASQLDLKPWTLRRKLRAEECDFTGLLDEIRKQLAHRYLQDKNFPISDIAASLGYSEQSSFNRAFKRWYLCTPVEYRQRNHH